MANHWTPNPGLEVRFLGGLPKGATWEGKRVRSTAGKPGTPKDPGRKVLAVRPTTKC